MGITKVTASISNLGNTKPGFEELFLVDTGAIHCMAPKDKLKKAGIKVEGRATYELANGQPYEVDYGFARISFMGDETVTKIIFGPEKTEPILGVVVLEDVGIMVDPVTRTLKRMPAIPLK
jgi:clan AA aspartic protease